MNINSYRSHLENSTASIEVYSRGVTAEADAQSKKHGWIGRCRKNSDRRLVRAIPSHDRVTQIRVRPFNNDLPAPAHCEYASERPSYQGYTESGLFQHPSTKASHHQRIAQPGNAAFSQHAKSILLNHATASLQHASANQGRR